MRVNYLMVNYFNNFNMLFQSFKSGLILGCDFLDQLNYEIKRHLDLHSDDSVGENENLNIREVSLDEIREWNNRWNRPNQL